MHLVFAVLEQPVSTLEAVNTSGLHSGLQRVQLLKPELPVPTLPPDTHSLDIRAPNVLVPSQETTYWCYIMELPTAFARHHIVMVCAGRGIPTASKMPCLESCPQSVRA